MFEAALHGYLVALRLILAIGAHVYLDTLILMGSISAQYVPWQAAFGVAAAFGSLSFFAVLGFGARLLAPVFANPRAWVVLEGGVGMTMWAIALGLALG